MLRKEETFRSVLFSTSIIFTIQSILWICVCIACILTYTCQLPMPTYESNDFISTTIVKFYFEGDECKINQEVPGYGNVESLLSSTPSIINGCMIGYLIASTVLIFLSISIYVQRDKRRLFRFLLIAWCLVALAIAILDLTWTVDFIIDYIVFKEEYTNRAGENATICNKENSTEYEDISMVPAVMFVASARGFALWLINICLIIYFVAWLYREQRERKYCKTRCRPHIQGYDNSVFQESPVPVFERVAKPYSRATRGDREHFVEREREYFPRRLSVSSFEAVTPFNQEEYTRKPSQQMATAGAVRRVDNEPSCTCAEWPDTHRTYHGHACKMLRSELEETLQARRARAKPADFSHDIRNFSQGGGRRKEQSKGIPEVSTPSAINCNNSRFY